MLTLLTVLFQICNRLSYSHFSCALRLTGQVENHVPQNVKDTNSNQLFYIMYCSSLLLTKL